MIKREFIAILSSGQLQMYFHRFGYIGIYLYFVTVDQLSPIPEEVSLIIIGYLSSHRLISPFLAGLFSLAAFFTIDVIYFYLTKTGNKLIARFVKVANNPKMNYYKDQLLQNTPKTLVILSFIPRIRLLSPVFAAVVGLTFVKFMIYNGLGLILFIAVYIGVGMAFHNSIASLLPKVGVYQHVIFIMALIVIIGVSIIVYKKLRSD